MKLVLAALLILIAFPLAAKADWVCDSSGTVCYPLPPPGFTDILPIDPDHRMPPPPSYKPQHPVHKPAPKPQGETMLCTCRRKP
jgi:hypothetical protein